jgi:type I restriction enzyme R subunit
LTAQERVEKAVARLIEQHTFNEEQLNWLSYIKEHLIENLAISQEDFEIMPVFERRGGLSKARRIFGDDFETIIHAINEALAA